VPGLHRALWPAPEQRIVDCGATVAYLHDDQFFPGWTCLVLKRHATELWQLERGERAALIEEVSRVARAVGAAFDAVKVNYELLGRARRLDSSAPGCLRRIYRIAAGTGRR